MRVRNLTVSLDADTDAALRAYSRRTGVPVSVLVRMAARDMLLDAGLLTADGQAVRPAGAAEGQAVRPAAATGGQASRPAGASRRRDKRRK